MLTEMTPTQHQLSDLFDLDIVRLSAETGYAGCVLKGHYAATTGRAVAAGRDSGLACSGDSLSTVTSAG